MAWFKKAEQSLVATTGQETHEQFLFSSAEGLGTRLAIGGGASRFLHVSYEHRVNVIGPFSQERLSIAIRQPDCIGVASSGRFFESYIDKLKF